MQPGTFFRHGGSLLLWSALAIVGLSGCSAKKEPPRARPPAPVAVATVAQKDIPVQLRSIGNVEAIESVAIKSQVSGEIHRVHFKEGQDVQKGQLLFTIDPRPYEAALRKAEASLARNQVQARNAQQDTERYAQLVKDGIVTQEQYEQYRTKADSYAADVTADRAAVERAKVDLGYCFIKAPIAGRAGNLAVTAGNVVKANENPALVTINQISPVYVGFTVPEKELAVIKQQLTSGTLPVEAVAPNDSKGAERGVISFLDNTVDPATGTIRLKGTFENPDRRLWPGQFVNVVMTLAKKPNAAVVPSGAVQTGQQGPFVFVVGADQGAELRPVVTSVTFEGLTVIEKGLKPGEMVVTEGQMRLAPGAKVMVKQPGQGEAQTSPTGAGQVTGPPRQPVVPSSTSKGTAN